LNTIQPLNTIIELPSDGGYHFSSNYHIKPFIGHYFQEINSKSDFVNKATIIQIEYKPDDIYSSSDGHAGNCWEAIINDSRETNNIAYYFRNFRDLVRYYEKLGFKLQ
jgi:hypothetical protein